MEVLDIALSFSESEELAKTAYILAKRLPAAESMALLPFSFSPARAILAAPRFFSLTRMRTSNIGIC